MHVQSPCIYQFSNSGNETFTPSFLFASNPSFNKAARSSNIQPKATFSPRLLLSSTILLSQHNDKRHARRGGTATSDTLAIPAHEDDPEIRAKYRPFLLGDEIETPDW